MYELLVNIGFMTLYQKSELVMGSKPYNKPLFTKVEVCFFLPSRHAAG